MNKNMILVTIVGIAIIVGGIVFLWDGDTSSPINEEGTLSNNQIDEVINKTLVIINSIAEKNINLDKPSTFLIKSFKDNIAKLSDSDSNLEIRDFAKKVYKHYK